MSRTSCSRGRMDGPTMSMLCPKDSTDSSAAQNYLASGSTDLRHTHAMLLLLAGVPPHVVSMRLGYKSVAFTLQQYAHVLPQQQADAVERLVARVLGET